MLRKRERVIVFGAGLAGQRACRFLRHRHDVIAFADNDLSKRGSRVLRRPVLGPADLAGTSFDRIYVASIHAAQISAQLLNDLAVPPVKLRLVPRDVMLGEYEVSRWTYAAIAVLAALAVGVVTIIAYAVRSLIMRG